MQIGPIPPQSINLTPSTYSGIVGGLQNLQSLFIRTFSNVPEVSKYIPGDTVFKKIFFAASGVFFFGAFIYSTFQIQSDRKKAAALTAAWKKEQGEALYKSATTVRRCDTPVKMSQLQQAVDLGHTDAMFALARECAKARDPHRSFRLLSRGAKLEDKRCLLAMGHKEALMFHPLSLKEAKEHYSKVQKDPLYGSFARHHLEITDLLIGLSHEEQTLMLANHLLSDWNPSSTVIDARFQCEVESTRSSIAFILGDFFAMQSIDHPENQAYKERAYAFYNCLLKHLDENTKVSKYNTYFAIWNLVETDATDSRAGEALEQIAKITNPVKTKAEAGDPNSQYEWGSYLMGAHDRLVTPIPMINRAKGIEYLQNASLAGNRWAEFTLFRLQENAPPGGGLF